MKTQTTLYRIGSHLLPCLINDDCSGLEDGESGEVDGFENGIKQYDCPEGYHFGHWDITDTEDEFGLCDITDLRGHTTEVVAVWFKNTTSYDFKDGELIRLVNGQFEVSWSIYDVPDEVLRNCIAWNDPNGDFDDLDRVHILEIFLSDFIISRPKI